MTAEELITLPHDDMVATIKRWTTPMALKSREWDFWRRDDQISPLQDWRIWLVMAGRGYGKTRIGAEWVNGVAAANPGARIALVGATLTEARGVMVEGESGVLRLHHDQSPVWEPSLRKLTWRNGSVATLYSAAEPESLRGPQHDFAWADEIAKWPLGIAAWDNLMLGLRLGARPQAVATTTPRPVPLVRRLVEEKGVAISRGRTLDNIKHLPPEFIDGVTALYGGTRWGRQELEGELIEDVAGALWSRDLIERQRALSVPDMKRIVIGVDPPVSADGDACGIVAVGLGRDDKAYVLADHTVKGASPEGWARAVAAAVEAWGADRVVAEDIRSAVAFFGGYREMLASRCRRHRRLAKQDRQNCGLGGWQLAVPFASTCDACAKCRRRHRYRVERHALDCRPYCGGTAIGCDDRYRSAGRNRCTIVAFQNDRPVFDMTGRPSQIWMIPQNSDILATV